MPAKNLTDRVLGLLEKADPIDRLRLLIELRELTPGLRADALGELLADGWTRYAVAQELDVTPQAVQAWNATRPKRSKR
jgi:hypothetical protein